jgi:hypothetical protein
MSTISGYGDTGVSYDQPAELPPGSDNPVEDAGANPPVEEQETQSESSDLSGDEWVDGVIGSIEDNILEGNYESPKLGGPVIVHNGGEDD